MICLYCNLEKDESEFSQEHVIPKALGGNIETNNPFSINNVCKKCNNISGLFIDAAFIKSWTSTKSKAYFYYKYFDLTIDSVVPLDYLGEFQSTELDDNICDVWTCAGGDLIYHFHKPYPKDIDCPPIVGIPSTAYKKEIDPGFVIFFLLTSNKAWHPAILKALNQQFKKSRFYLGVGPKPENIPNFFNLEEDKKKYLNLVMPDGRVQNILIKIGVNFDFRFICKIALGIGGAVLHESFQQSRSAQLLRDGMWAKTYEQKLKTEVNLKGSFAYTIPKNLEPAFIWESGHLVLLNIINKSLYLNVNFYGTDNFTVLLSNEPQHWSGILASSIAYVICPTLKRAVGPVMLKDFLAFQLGEINDLDSLNQLKEEMNRKRDIPPFFIDREDA
jgi:hypothetical protein